MYAKNDKKLNTRYLYDNCKFYGHVRKDCYHLIEYLKDKIKLKKKDSEKKDKKSDTEVVNQASASISPGLSQEEVQLFRDFLAKSSNDFSFPRI